MKLSNIKTTEVHALAKSLGIKNLKSAGRTRDIIISEIIALKDWASHDEKTVEFLFKGGEIKECRAQTNDKPGLGNQSSAGKSKRKGETEFNKRARQYIDQVLAAIEELSHDDHHDIASYLDKNGFWPITTDCQVWGDGGLCDHCTRWGLRTKPGAKPIVEAKPSEPKADKAERKPRTTVSRDGLISLSSLCEKHGIDGKIARRKLRSKMSKPEAGWHFDEETAKEVEQIITR